VKPEKAPLLSEKSTKGKLHQAKKKQKHKLCFIVALFLIFVDFISLPLYQDYLGGFHLELVLQIKKPRKATLLVLFFIPKF